MHGNQSAGQCRRPAAAHGDRRKRFGQGLQGDLEFACLAFEQPDIRPEHGLVTRAAEQQVVHARGSDPQLKAPICAGKHRILLTAQVQADTGDRQLAALILDDAQHFLSVKLQAEKGQEKKKKEVKQEAQHGGKASGAPD